MSTEIDITLIVPNPDQPRTVFDQAELEGLAQSIREVGLIQPITSLGNQPLDVLTLLAERCQQSRLAVQ